MKRTRIIVLLLILLFPSVLYLVLTTGKHNFISLPYYGNKYVIEKEGSDKGDTVYFQLDNQYFVNTQRKLDSIPFDSSITIIGLFSLSSKHSNPYEKEFKMMSANLATVQEKLGETKNIQIYYLHEEGWVPYQMTTVDSIYYGKQLKAFIDSSKTINDLKTVSDNVKAKSGFWNLGYCVSVFGEANNLFTLFESLKNDRRYFENTNATPKNNSQKEPGIFNTLFLVDKERHVRGYYNGTLLKEVNNLIDDVKVLIADYEIKRQREEKKNAAKN